MFKRPIDTYIVSKDAIARILRDSASPLNHIARLIPDGSTALDIGAGNGLLGQVLKELNKSVLIDGIEPNEYAAEIARPYYRSIFVGFSHEYLELIKLGDYDFIILADVVEHTVNPSEFLTEICAYLSDKTQLLISLPNIAFGGQRLSILNGSFNYVDSGLLEKTHLRFFTIDSAKELFSSIPLSCDSVTCLSRSFYRVEFSRKAIRASLFQLFRLACTPSARAYQYLFLLHKGTTKDPIVISCGAAPIEIIFDACFYRPAFKKTAKFFLELFGKK